MVKRWFGVAAAAFLVSASLQAQPATVGTRMRNVNFHLGKGVELRVDDLRGRLASTASGPPVFDDVNSYRVDIDFAQVALTPDSLSNLLNNYVFAYEGAPLSKLKVGVEGQELTQSGVLKKGVPVPFTMRATIAATPDGKIRIHPTKMKAAGVIPKRLLDFFGLDLEKLVKVKEGIGVTVDGDDLLLDPERLLPPPRIRGKLTRVSLQNGVVVEEFGARGKTALEPPRAGIKNYMYYRGGTLRFGKLTMSDTDMVLVDADQKDVFDFSPAQYEEQLVAGYSKNTRAKGLVVYMPDRADLTRGSGAGPVGTAGHQAADQQPPHRKHHE